MTTAAWPFRRFRVNCLTTDLGASFYAVREGWIGPDVLFKVHVTPDAVHAARVGGGWGVYLARLAILGELAPVFPTNLTAVPRLESRYGDLDPRSRDFLARDPRNFRLHAAQVERIVLALRDVFGRRRRGTVTFHRRDGERRVRLHVTPSDLSMIGEALEATAFRVERDGGS